MVVPHHHRGDRGHGSGIVGLGEGGAVGVEVIVHGLIGHDAGEGLGVAGGRRLRPPLGQRGAVGPEIVGENLVAALNQQVIGILGVLFEHLGPHPRRALWQRGDGVLVGDAVAGGVSEAQPGVLAGNGQAPGGAALGKAVGDAAVVGGPRHREHVAPDMPPAPDEDMAGRYRQRHPVDGHVVGLGGAFEDEQYRQPPGRDRIPPRTFAPEVEDRTDDRLGNRAFARHLASPLPSGPKLRMVDHRRGATPGHSKKRAENHRFGRPWPLGNALAPLPSVLLSTE